MKPPLTIVRPTKTPLKYSVNCSGTGRSSFMLCRMSASRSGVQRWSPHIDRAGSAGPTKKSTNVAIMATRMTLAAMAARRAM